MKQELDCPANPIEIFRWEETDKLLWSRTVGFLRNCQGGYVRQLP